MLIEMKVLSVALLSVMPGYLVLLSTGRAATEGRNSNVSLLMPST
jgi:hypothetical protein